MVLSPVFCLGPVSLSRTVLCSELSASARVKLSCRIRTECAASKASKVSVAEKFNEHFSNVYGDRWTTLSESLEQPSSQVAYLNIFKSAKLSSTNGSNPAVLLRTLSTVFNGNVPLTNLQQLPLPLPVVALPGSHGASEDSDMISSQLFSNDEDGLKPAYLLDLASVFPPLALAPHPGQKVLDMCAAPGGKSLLLSAQLFAEQESLTPSLLVCNDRSPARRNRLRRVLQDYLPPHLLTSEQVKVTGHDGARFYQHEAEEYDAILLDAPCSSERHLLQKQKEGGKALTKEEWSPTRSGRNASTQVALLLSAVKSLKPGGRVVYSTCSISPLENDGVVAKVLDKMKGAVQVLPPQDVCASFTAVVPHIERTQLGYMLMPDFTGWGPMYWALLTKTGGGMA